MCFLFEFKIWLFVILKVSRGIFGVCGFFFLVFYKMKIFKWFLGVLLRWLSFKMSVLRVFIYFIAKGIGAINLFVYEFWIKISLELVL